MRKFVLVILKIYNKLFLLINKYLVMIQLDINNEKELTVYGRVKHNGFLKNVKIGTSCFINDGVYFNSGPDANIIIGNDVTLSNNVYITCMGLDLVSDGRTHIYNNVIIEDSVWIGANCTILKGVTIGKNSVVAAGSVVNKSVPPYSVVGGIPSRVLRKLDA